MSELGTRPREMPLGRQAELGVLTRVLDDIATDRASVVVVQGEAGQGKTALLDWAAGAARGRGFEVLRVTGIEFERGLAFSGLTAVLRPLLHRLDDLTDVQAQALRGALGLERSEAPVLTVYAATLSLLSLGADASPVLVVVDDAHWIDPSSLEALVFAAHRCDADRVGFAFAQRSGVHCALDQTRFARIDLGGLDRDAAVALLSDAGVVALVAVRCWNLTNGNPLALIEGARGLSPAQRRGEAPLPAVLPVDDRLLDEYRTGLAGLAPATLRALGVAALASDDDLGVITAALADLGGGPDDLGPAEHRGIVALAGSRVRWRHPLLRYAVHQAAVVGEALGDRVRRWTTINEPWCAAMLGYAAGSHAPGRTEPGAAVSAAHHLLLGHGLAVDALRDRVRADDAEIGITLNPYPVVPATASDADRDAARRIDGIANRLWYDPVLVGRYPDDVLADLSTVSDLAHVRDGDLAQIARPLDALGLNYDRRHHVSHAPGASAAPSPWPGSPDVAFTQATGTPTSNGWAVEPGDLYDALVRLDADYHPRALYIHESGGAFPDRIGPDGGVHDADRLAYLDAHVRACHDALRAGVGLRGFFVWSLLDNFEWAEGYSQRFGVVHVDFATQERVPKDGALWYRDVVRANGLDAGLSSPTGGGPAS